MHERVAKLLLRQSGNSFKPLYSPAIYVPWPNKNSAKNCESGRRREERRGRQRESEQLREKEREKQREKERRSVHAAYSTVRYPA